MGLQASFWEVAMRKSKGAVFDFGTSPHGLSAELPRTGEKALEAGGLRSLEDAFAVRGSEAGLVAGAPLADARHASPPQGAASQRVQLHYLEMEEREFLHVFSAVEQDRDRTRIAIRKGFAVDDDLKATDSLWNKLWEIQSLRMGWKS
jgi:hypothetical protein